MFHSNLPTLLGRQDFEQSHADLLAAARAGETVDPNRATLVAVFTVSEQDFLNFGILPPTDFVASYDQLAEQIQWFEPARRGVVPPAEWQPLPPAPFNPQWGEPPLAPLYPRWYGNHISRTKLND